MATFRADASFASPNKNDILAPVRRYLPVEFARPEAKQMDASHFERKFVG